MFFASLWEKPLEVLKIPKNRVFFRHFLGNFLIIQMLPGLINCSYSYRNK